MKPGQSGRILRVDHPTSPDIVRRLMEMGMVEGEWVMVLHESPWGGDPIAVRVRGNLLGVRRDEAIGVEVQP